jgi:hypothetical protein
VTVILGAIGFALIAAAMNGAARMPLNPGRYTVRRSAERPAPVLTATLVPSPRALPGRPPAAGTARQVYRITDCPAAHQGARVNREG